MPTDESKVQDIFFCALDKKSPEEIDAYLDQACQGDGRLRNRVKRLLDAEPKVGSFLRGDVGDLVATIDQPIIENTGTHIGPYKLREKIGEGGFGVVYVAEQQEPVARKVALKIIKPGMDTKEVVARFETERQALALMDHPHIAKVFDAGATEFGRPYVVMELVHGLPITAFCDERKLTNRQRLNLFIDVCRAVQHAHQKGIIHRDLKPSNILVTLDGDRAIPKVIDFGVAKALSQRLTDKTVYTAYGQMMGTPLYMSPEQASLRLHEVDTRSDIFSLGVLLYELLTGTTPFDRELLKDSSLDEIRRLICEVDPPRPSVRISTLRAERLSTVSAVHRTDPRKMRQSYRGELDWVVMKAMDKDRSRRYESASALAADVERFLQDEPVQACPPSTWYMLKKFARKNRTATSMLVLVLLLLISVAVSGFVLAKRAEEVAKLEQLESSQRLELDREIQESLLKIEALQGQLGNSPEHDQAVLAQAREYAERAQRLAASDLADANVKERVKSARERLEKQEQENTFLRKITELRLLPYDATFPGEMSNASNRQWAVATRYQQFFASEGLDFQTTKPEQAVANLEHRSEKVRQAIRDAFYSWYTLEGSRPLLGIRYESADEQRKGENEWRVIFRVVIGSDPWQEQYDAAMDREVKLRLLQQIDMETQSPASIIWLVKSIDQMGANFHREQLQVLSEMKSGTLDLLRRCQLRHPEDVFVALALANKYMDESERDDANKTFYQAEAIRFASIAVTLYPESVVLRHELGRMLKSAQRFDEALEVYEQTARLLPGRDSLQMLGDAFRDKQRFPEAVAAYRQALALDPVSEVIPVRISHAYVRNGEHNLAVAELQKGVRANPHSIVLCVALVKFSQLADDLPTGVAALDQAKTIWLDEDFDEYRPYECEQLTRELVLAGDTEGGYEVFKRGRRAFRSWFGYNWDDFDTELREIFFFDANAFIVNNKEPHEFAWWKEGKPEGVASLLELLIDKTPEEPLNYVYLARWRRSDDPEGAIALCERALAAAPGKADRIWAQIEIGRIRQKQQRPEEAIAELRKVLEFPDPSENTRELRRYATALKVTAFTLEQLKDYDAAADAKQLADIATERVANE